MDHGTGLCHNKLVLVLVLVWGCQCHSHTHDLKYIIRFGLAFAVIFKGCVEGVILNFYLLLDNFYTNYVNFCDYMKHYFITYSHLLSKLRSGLFSICSKQFRITLKANQVAHGRQMQDTRYYKLQSVQ